MKVAIIFLGTFGAASAAVTITGKEMGIQYINGTTATSPLESSIHRQGTTTATSVINNRVQVMLGISEIVIDFGSVANPIVFSSEAFSGLRFYDVSEIDFLDNDPAVSLPSLLGSSLNFSAGNTDVEEAGGAMFSSNRLIVDENNIYVNFSGLMITEGTGTKVVISLGEIVPEPRSVILMSFAAMALGFQRRR